MARRREGIYFPREAGAPEPVVVELKSRVRFRDADPMGIVWFGKYPVFFEDGSAEIGRVCGLSYRDFYEAELRAPVVECHIDYHAPLSLDEEFTIRASLIWNEGARLNTEYRLIKGDGSGAASGYTVQLFTDLGGSVCIVSPPLLKRCRERWMRGDFH
jgi:acyl-CoA thioester hydrolase